ncbi:unnamed protein product, partial [Prorocentrum cordatum]
AGMPFASGALAALQGERVAPSAGLLGRPPGSLGRRQQVVGDHLTIVRWLPDWDDLLQSAKSRLRWLAPDGPDEAESSYLPCLHHALQGYRLLFETGGVRPVEGPDELLAMCAVVPY